MHFATSCAAATSVIVIVALVATRWWQCTPTRGHRESFFAAAEAECSCTVHGKCLTPEYIRQGGCDLINNYRTCMKNARRRFGTVVLNTGELLRRSHRGASIKQLQKICRRVPSTNSATGFGCPGNVKPTKTDGNVEVP